MQREMRVGKKKRKGAERGKASFEGRVKEGAPASDNERRGKCANSSLQAMMRPAQHSRRSGRTLLGRRFPTPLPAVRARRLCV